MWKLILFAPLAPRAGQIWFTMYVWYAAEAPQSNAGPHSLMQGPTVCNELFLQPLLLCTSSPLSFLASAQRSRKSLFETSQERRRSDTPLVSPQTSSLSPGAQYTLRDVSLTPSTSSTLPQHNPTLYSVPVTPSFQDAPAASTPVKADADNLAELSQKKAYRKLVARIRGVHPELGPDETLRGIVNVRAAHQGTLTGMSMTEIISKVRDSVLETAAASSVDSMDEFERMVNAPFEDKNPHSEPAPSFAPAPYKTFELKCQFCSRVFKSTNEIATKKVYDIHMNEHEVENKNIYESLQDDPTNFDDLTPCLKTNNTSEHSNQSLSESQSSEKDNVPLLETKPEPDQRRLPKQI